MRSALSVTLYTRAGCHLCDDARDVLIGQGLDPKVVDIEGDPDLVARHGLRIPVVEINGRERFFGRVDPVLLSRIIANEGRV